MHSKDLTGLTGEDIASRHLETNNYQILYRRYRLPRWGEIDIIAIYNNVLYFVEVKTSKSKLDPLESINQKKLRSLVRSINFFLISDGKAYINYPLKIKVIGVRLSISNEILSLDDIDFTT